MNEITQFLAVYMDEVSAQKYMGMFTSLLEAKLFVESLLPKRKSDLRGMRFDVYEASKEAWKEWICSERSRGNIVFRFIPPGNDRFLGLSSCGPLVWESIKGNADIRLVV